MTPTDGTCARRNASASMPTYARSPARRRPWLARRAEARGSVRSTRASVCSTPPLPQVVEDADRRHRVVRRINHIIGHETFDITDDRNGALLACELFGHASLCSALRMAAYMGSSFTGGLPAVATAATMHHAQNRRGEQQDFPHTEPYAIPRNDTIECLTLVSPGRSSLATKHRQIPPYSS